LRVHDESVISSKVRR